MKRSFKIFVALFALLIATTGVCSNVQSERTSATAATAQSAEADLAAAYRETGYLYIHVLEGVADVTYTDKYGSLTHLIVSTYVALEVEAGSSYDIHGAYGFHISNIAEGSPYGTIGAGETATVVLTLTETYP